MRITRGFGAFVCISTTARTSDAAIFTGPASVMSHHDNVNCTGVPVQLGINRHDRNPCRIQPGDSCMQYDVGTTHKCVTDLSELLRSSFGKSPYVLVDYYSDKDCNVLSQTLAFLADGKCHEFYDASRITSQRTTIYANGRVTIEGATSHGSGNEPCSSAYEVQVDQPAANINIGTCIQTTEVSKKLYSVGTTDGSPTTSSSGSADTTTKFNATTVASSVRATSHLSSAMILLGSTCYLFYDLTV